MKPAPLIIVAIVSALLLTFASCQKAEKVSHTWYLTGPDSASVVKEILAATDAFADASRKMDADKEIQLWDSSPQMMFAENGMQYANRDSIYSAMKGWYKQSDAVELRWEERNILPLSPRAAHLFGRFYIRLKLKSDAIVEATVIDTWLLVKQDDNWKIMRGHESYKLEGAK